MSLINYEGLNQAQLIGEYVLECRGKGHYLAYSDHNIIKEWLQVAQDADSLLLVLADIVPKYYQDKEKTFPPSLDGIRQKVLNQLQALAMRARAVST